jgi:hypothetical protein
LGLKGLVVVVVVVDSSTEMLSSYDQILQRLDNKDLDLLASVLKLPNNENRNKVMY